jgi:hypothetical protein
MTPAREQGIVSVTEPSGKFPVAWSQQYRSPLSPVQFVPQVVVPGQVVTPTVHAFAWRAGVPSGLQHTSWPPAPVQVELHVLEVW